MSDEFLPESPKNTDYHNSVGVVFPGTLMERMGMDVIEHTPERTVITMPVEGNTQRIGILHGGASAALAETAGSLAAAASILDDEHIAVGVELSISHLRTARSGMVTATATAEHIGRTSTVHLVRVSDDEGRTLATARISNRIIPKRPA